MSSKTTTAAKTKAAKTITADEGYADNPIGVLRAIRDIPIEIRKRVCEG